MKKLLVIFAVTIAIATMGTTVFAASPNTTKIDNRIAKLQQEQQQIEQREQSNESKVSTYTSKMSEYNAFRQTLIQDRITVINNQDKNLAILDQNKSLRLSIANAIKTVEQNGTTLPADTLSTLKADNQQIKGIWTDIDSTKGQIEAIDEQNKTVIKNKDYTTLDANFQKIYSIQDWRNQQLTQINGILQQMNSLLSGNTTNPNTTFPNTTTTNSSATQA
jgi:predicted  nucleic acid-binding Zn-ribbon protein